MFFLNFIIQPHKTKCCCCLCLNIRTYTKCHSFIHSWSLFHSTKMQANNCKTAKIIWMRRCPKGQNASMQAPPNDFKYLNITTLNKIRISPSFFQRYFARDNRAFLFFHFKGILRGTTEQFCSFSLMLECECYRRWHTWHAVVCIFPSTIPPSIPPARTLK